MLTAALAETDEVGTPTAHAIDAARYILDQVYGKAGRAVDVGVTGSFDDWVKAQKPD